MIMKSVNVKYNPFLPELRVLINGRLLEEVAVYSALHSYKHKPFIEWCSRFFDLIGSEVNDSYRLSFTATGFENMIFRKLARNTDLCKEYEFHPVSSNRDVIQRLLELRQLGDSENTTEVSVGLWSEEECLADQLLSLMDESGQYAITGDGEAESLYIPLVKVKVRKVAFMQDLMGQKVPIALNTGEVEQRLLDRLQRLGKNIYLISMSDHAGFEGKKVNIFDFKAVGSDIIEEINSLIQGTVLPQILSDRSYFYGKKHGDYLSRSEKEQLDLLCAVEKVYRIEAPKESFVGRAFEVQVTTLPASEDPDYILKSRDGLLTFDGNIATAFEPGEDLIQVYAGEDPIPVCVQRVVITEQTLITELEVPSSYLCLSEGDETELSVRYSPEDATNPGEIRWQSVDPDIAEISNGILTAKGVGTTEIYVYTPEVERKIDVEVQAHLQDIVLSDVRLILNAGETREFKYSPVPENCYEKEMLQVDSSNPKVAFYRGGSIIAASPGDATIYVGPADRKQGSVLKTCHVTVKKKGIF